MKRHHAIVLLILIALMVGILSAGAVDNGNEISILFTHDMHSHLETDAFMVDGSVLKKGGFAKLKTAVDAIRATYPDTFMLDAGDFSMGTLFQTIESSQAPELRLMGEIGFDATTLGNHEFDYRGPGLADMLNAAVGSGDTLPLLLVANIDWDRTLADPVLADTAKLVKKAMDKYGSKNYALIEKNGIKIAVFGIFGKEADAYAPESGLYFLDPIERSKEVVANIQVDGTADIIVCISHSGTKEDPDESEDELLAKAVPEIDLIISGHTHTKLDKPIQIGKTRIVSCGSYTYDLGHVVLTKSGDQYDIKSYDLIPLNETVEDDVKILSKVTEFKATVNDQYLKQFGYQYDEVLATSGFSFTPIEKFGLEQGEDPLGNLVADSYIYAVKQIEGNTYEPIDVAVVPMGVVRNSFGEGEITVSEVFNVSSLGIGPDGIPGYPLVSLYLTGAELKTMAEIDISVSEIMIDARLYINGLTYSYNPNRLILNRVTDVNQVTDNGMEELQEDHLYRVVCGLYSCQMLGAVESKSYGLLSLVPKDKNGDPINDFEKYILYSNGKELKEWTALAGYLQSFEKENGIAKMPAYYRETHGRKVEESSTNIGDLLKNPNKIFFMVMGVLAGFLVILLILVLLLVKLVRHVFRKKYANFQ